MELSDSKIKEFLVFLEMEPCNFPSKLERIKVIHPKINGNSEKLLILQETEFFYTSGNETFLYFSKAIFRILAYLEP